MNFAHLIMASTVLVLGQTQPGFVETRHVYERGTPCVLPLNVPDGAQVTCDVSGYLPQNPAVTNGQASYIIDTKLLRAGEYIVRAQLAEKGQPGRTFEFPLTISPAHDEERIPVWRWGGGYGDAPWWTRHGFTGAFTGLDSPLEDPAAPTGRKMRDALDAAARYDFDLGFYFHPLTAKQLTENQDLLCLRADAQRAPEKPYPLEPAVIDFAKQVAESWITPFCGHPGLRHVMFNSEFQTPFCINDAAVQLAQQELGINLKDIIVTQRGPEKLKPEDIKDGLIEDDNPQYRFLQWWWQRGHGTAPLNQAMNEIVKKLDPRLITWHEPYRLAPVRGSHKGLDCIATWTYGHPDIKRLCYTTYLQAAARPEHQRVQQDITLFVYGRYVMPINESTAKLSDDFAGKDPFFTAGPDYVREAIWLVLSQRPDILCFYSAGKLSPEKPSQDPMYASPETFDAIGQTCEEIVKPCGPALLKCRRMTPRVALLMSAASTWFPASPHLAGYANEQTLPFASLLMMNHVPFDVLLDDDILEGALDRYDVLVMPKADTLTRGMHERIVAFANGKGKVIADASLRATIPNTQITKFDFTHQTRMDGIELAKNNAVTAEEDRAIMEGYAKELASLLADVPRPCAAATPRVLTNSLDGGAVQYHFFINDDRTYGPRFGQWKLHFELGVPQTADVSVAIDNRPVLYDVLRRQQIEYKTESGRACFPIRMAAARGKIIAALPEPIKQIAIDLPNQAKRGETLTITARVLGESGNCIDAVLPLNIKITDSMGRPVELTPYTATEKGAREIRITPALNDSLGTWHIRITDLIAGKSGEVSFEVTP